MPRAGIRVSTPCANVSTKALRVSSRDQTSLGFLRSQTRTVLSDPPPRVTTVTPFRAIVTDDGAPPASSPTCACSWAVGRSTRVLCSVRESWYSARRGTAQSVLAC
eukprot:1210237-Rhodomonas_salina.1